MAQKTETFWDRLQKAFDQANAPSIARRLNVEKQTVYKWRDGTMPSLETLIAIAESTGSSLHWLVTGDGSQTVANRGSALEPGEVPVYFGAKEHELIQKLAGQSERTFEDEVREIVLETLKNRGLIKDRIEQSNIIFFGDHVPKMVMMSLQGEIAAGEPLMIFNNPEQVRVPQDFDRRGKSMFVLRVRGESMIDEGIRDGDFIVCEATKTATRGQTVVAVIDGEKATVKNYYPERGRIRLQPANDLHEPIYVTDDRLEIQGVVVGLWRPPQ